MKTIPLSQGKFAMVDDEDYDYLNQWKWRASKSGNTFYAKRELIKGELKTTISMHRSLLQPPRDLQIDHKNGNGLDNQRSNLRLATHSQNRANIPSFKTIKGKIRTSKFKGVHLHSSKRSWVANLRHNKKLIYLGAFKDELMAAKAYDLMAVKVFGEFAYLNFK